MTKRLMDTRAGDVFLFKNHRLEVLCNDTPGETLGSGGMLGGVIYRHRGDCPCGAGVGHALTVYSPNKKVEVVEEGPEGSQGFNFAIIDSERKLDDATLFPLRSESP